MLFIRSAVSVFVALLASAPLCAQHPRLWVKQSELAELRSRATASNPVYENGLKLLAEEAKRAMDAGTLPAADSGGTTWDQYPNEMYSMLFAFMSLIENDATVRGDYAARARALLMFVIEKASAGEAAGEPFRDRAFATSDRSRWWGEGFGLTVDWIYPTLTAADKALIRSVFLRWAEQNTVASTTNYNHPQPVGVVNSPLLISDETAVRWSSNNYYLAHMRNLGLMALSFDAADDPDGRLTGYLASATGAWLYVWDRALRTHARGGFSPEGFEYGPDSLGFGMHFLYALHTAGEDVAEKWGAQAEWWRNPFWDSVLPAYLHSLSPARVIYPEYEWIGAVYQPAWFGDGQNYWLADAVSIFAPLGLYWKSTGQHDRAAAARWIQTHTPPGGEEKFLERVSDSSTFRDAILYFLLFDPGAAAPADPRPGLSRTFHGEGINRVLARTSWEEDASLFTWFLSWNRIDHQLAEGNQFELYRSGEWLTKGRVGWDGISSLCSIGRSDYHNTLAIENERGTIEPSDWLYACQQNGSQMIQVSSGDPALVAKSFGSDFVYVTGDATPLYNSAAYEMDDVQHVSRSIVWLMPDHVVVYDRAETATTNRFKRFWLNAENMPSTSSAGAVLRSDKGQLLHVRTLLPSNRTITAAAAEDLPDVANEEPMQHRLLVEATGGPASARFLHVLEATGGGAAEEATLIESSNGSYQGAAFGSRAVLFPVRLSTAFDTLTYTVPSAVTRHLISGLTPNGAYTVTRSAAGALAVVSVTAGGTQRADDGGLLDWSDARRGRQRPVRRSQ